MSSIKCPECSKRYNVKESKCPECGFKIEANNSFYVMMVVFAFIIVFGGKYLYNSLFDNNSSDKGIYVTSKNIDTSEIIAYNLSKDYVKARLKSPSSAVFPSGSEKLNHVIKISDDHYVINSWVESHNSFGVMIKTSFSCEMIFNGDKVSCKNLKVE